MNHCSAYQEYRWRQRQRNLALGCPALFEAGDNRHNVISSGSDLQLFGFRPLNPGP